MLTVIARSQHFELTPSSSLAAAQASLASELAPTIATLLQRSEQYIAKLERKQNNLVARSELLEGRLEGKGGLRKQRSLERLVRRAGTPTAVGGGREGEERALR